MYVYIYICIYIYIYIWHSRARNRFLMPVRVQTTAFVSKYCSMKRSALGLIQSNTPQFWSSAPQLAVWLAPASPSSRFESLRRGPEPQRLRVPYFQPHQIPPDRVCVCVIQVEVHNNTKCTTNCVHTCAACTHLCAACKSPRRNHTCTCMRWRYLELKQRPARLLSFYLILELLPLEQTNSLLSLSFCFVPACF